MTRSNNIKQVAALAPDYMGFIFYKPSARFFSGTIPDLPKSIKKVGVFVTEDVLTVAQLVEKHRLDLVQLHGTESPQYIQELKTKLKGNTVEIIKVFSVKDSFNFSVLTPFESCVDYFLFDTKGQLPGGNGYTFDWSVLEKYPSQKPYILSGGIGADSIPKLNQFLSSAAAQQCIALDVNSKFELEPGLKNTKQLQEFKELLTTLLNHENNISR